MSYQQHHYVNRGEVGGDHRGSHYGGGGGGKRGDERRSYGGGGGMGGGKIKEGIFWSNQRETMEERGIKVKTNCFQLESIQSDNTNAGIHQYVVRIDALVKKRDIVSNDSTYAPTTQENVPNSSITQLMKKTFYLVKSKKELMNPEDDRSTVMSRRVLNHCQRKLQEVPKHPQSFVSFPFLPFTFCISILSLNAIFSAR